RADGQGEDGRRAGRRGETDAQHAAPRSDRVSTIRSLPAGPARVPAHEPATDATIARIRTPDAGPGHGPVASWNEVSAGGRLERISERVRLVRSHLDDETATTLQRNPHDDAAALFGDLKRTVARPRLHRRHVVSPRLSRLGAAPPIRTRLHGATPGGHPRRVPTNDFP